MGVVLGGACPSVTHCLPTASQKTTLLRALETKKGLKQLPETASTVGIDVGESTPELLSALQPLTKKGGPQIEHIDYTVW